MFAFDATVRFCLKTLEIEGRESTTNFGRVLSLLSPLPSSQKQSQAKNNKIPGFGIFLSFSVGLRQQKRKKMSGILHVFASVACRYGLHVQYESICKTKFGRICLRSIATAKLILICNHFRAGGPLPQIDRTCWF